MKTPQEIFDFVARALLAQGRPSGKIEVNSAGGGVPFFTCLYRSPDGCKCAAGHLIPDELYVPEMEGKAIYTLMLGLTGLEPLQIEDIKNNLILVECLQRAHDGPALYYGSTSAWLPRWRERMHEVARDFSLDATVLGISTP